MSNDYEDHFEDYMHGGIGQSPTSGGSIGGQGMQALNQSPVQLTAEGLDVHMTCADCGTPRRYTAEWPELWVIAANLAPDTLPLAPKGYRVDLERGAIVPNIICPHCREKDSLDCPFTPDEAMKYVNQGRASRFISPQQEQLWAQNFAAAQQRMRGR